MREGDVVYWPDPLPPLSHDGDESTPLRARPTGDEVWIRGTVERIEPRPNVQGFPSQFDTRLITIRPDEPPHAPPIDVAEVFVVRRPPTSV